MRYCVYGVGILSVLIIELYALHLGHDGVMLASSVSGIGFICGHCKGKIDGKKEC